jgi:hypothetical protein
MSGDEEKVNMQSLCPTFSILAGSSVPAVSVAVTFPVLAYIHGHTVCIYLSVTWLVNFHPKVSVHLLYILSDDESAF